MVRGLVVALLLTASCGSPAPHAPSCKVDCKTDADCYSYEACVFVGINACVLRCDSARDCAPANGGQSCESSETVEHERENVCLPTPGPCDWAI